MNRQPGCEWKSGKWRSLILICFAGSLMLVTNLANAANATHDKGMLLFPHYEVHELLNSSITHHYEKDTSILLAQLNKLQNTTRDYCSGSGSLDLVKVQYSKTYLAWLELSAVVMGPMLQHNTIRQIDFRPMRVNSLERAIKKQPTGAQAMALVGSPAKGFPALEYLFAKEKIKAGSLECSYAQEVLQDIARSVNDLKWQRFDVQSSAGEEEAQASDLSVSLQLYLNQLIGGMHNLAWDYMEKPLLVYQDSVPSKQAASWPFSELNLTEKTWAAQWAGISQLLVVKGNTLPHADKQVVPLEAYLRGLGQIELAEALAEHSDKMTAAMKANNIAKPTSVEQSVLVAKALKSFLETEVAKGLRVSIQFSSSDGD